MNNNILLEKAESFAIRIVKLCNLLKDDKKEFNISNQLFRSGTSIGANISESIYAVSKADFINKLHIAIKEASESKFWVKLLLSTNYINQNEFNSLNNDISELLKMLTTAIKTSKNNL